MPREALSSPLTRISLKQASNTHPYAGLSASLGSMHLKELAIAPPFLRYLQMPVVPTAGFDTDQLGTFTGEIARKGTPVDAAIEKAKSAARLAGTRFGLGSEGSFGPHPIIPLIAIDREVLAFYDKEQDVSIVQHLATHRTNYSHADIYRFEELSSFLDSLRFPSHGVVVSLVDERASVTIGKGLKELAQLSSIMTNHLPLRAGNFFRVSADMRAHMNPTRMRVIRALASKLARRILCRCPVCLGPGFGEETFETGVPCSECGEPTRLVRAINTKCMRCGHCEVRPYRQARCQADPRHCDFCNP